MSPKPERKNRQAAAPKQPPPQRDRPGRDVQAEADATKKLIAWAEQKAGEANAWWAKEKGAGKLVENHWQLIRAIGRAAVQSGELDTIEGLQPGAIAAKLAGIDPRKIAATAKKHLYEDKPAALAVAASAPQGREPGAEG